MEAETPTAAELQANPVVQAAFAAAWADSFPEDPSLRHEEGGFIYMNPATREVNVRRVPPGGTDDLNLSFPPVLAGFLLVATYNTHPHPPDRVWTAEPSPQDRFLASDSGIPWFVISHVGIFVTGPDRRVGGWAGPRGIRFSEEDAMIADVVQPAIPCDRALNIAQADAVVLYKDLTRHRIEVRLEADGWHVEYYFRGTGRFHTGGGPHYIISAETGEILAKKYYQ